MSRSSRMSSWRARVVVTTGVLALALLPGTPAWGQDPDETESTDTASDAVMTSLDFGDIGLGGSLPLYGLDGSAQITIPVPTGTVPSELTGTVTVPAWLDRGWLDVESADRPITRIVLDTNAATVPVSIPLAAAAVVGGTVTLELSSTLIPDAAYCPDVRNDPLRLIDASVAYAGLPAIPRTLADFLPPVLRQLTVFVPSEPDSDVIAAALTMTTSVTDYYGAQTVNVVVRPDSELQGAVSDGPFERSVVLSENTDVSAELVFPLDQAPPRLFVTGSGAELVDQARLVTSNVAELALSTKAFAGASVPPAVLAPDSTTLDDLGIGTVTGTRTASIPLDQTRLGRSAANVSVHLIGTYTPGSGSLTATVGGATLAAWPADDSGILDRWIEIPNATLERITTLDVTVEHPADSAAACGRTVVSEVTVDGSSVVESSGSSTSAPLGFGSLPQALMPRVGIALADNTFANVVRAVSIVDGLQRMSSRALDVSVVSVDDALNGTEPAIVIAPDGGLPETATLPLSSTGATTFTTVSAQGSETVLTLDAALPFASLQVAAAEGDAATLIASSNGAPEELDRLLGWLDADPSRWYGLSGDVLFGAAGSDPLSLSSADLAGAEADTAADPDGSNGLLVAGIVAAVVLVVIGLAAALIVWMRSRRGDSGSDDPRAP